MITKYQIRLMSCLIDKIVISSPLNLTPNVRKYKQTKERKWMVMFIVLFIFVWVIPMIIEWIHSVDWTGKYDDPNNISGYIPPHKGGYDWYKNPDKYK